MERDREALEIIAKTIKSVTSISMYAASKSSIGQKAAVHFDTLLVKIRVIHGIFPTHKWWGSKWVFCTNFWTEEIRLSSLSKSSFFFLTGLKIPWHVVMLSMCTIYKISIILFLLCICEIGGLHRNTAELKFYFSFLGQVVDFLSKWPGKS